MRDFISKTLASTLTLVGLISQATAASSIEWGDAAFGTDLTSTNSLLDNTFHYELGTFGAFIPDEANLPLWRDSWKLLDTTSYNTATKNFTDTAVINYNSVSSTWTADPANFTPDPPSPSEFAEGEQVYIWIYNNLDRDATTEWGVFTRLGSTDSKLPDWQLPFGAGTQQTFPLSFYMPDVNNSPWGCTPDVTGPGSSTSPSGSYSYQTHGFIPEPGSALLLTLGGLVGFTRRRK